MPGLERITQPPPLPERPADGHKGTFGTVIVVGGCATMLGAPAFVAGAALRSGAGLAKIAIDEALVPHVLTIEPSATGIALQGDASERAEQVKAAVPDHRAVLALGPGLGGSRGLDTLVPTLLAMPWRAVVLDADGLNTVARAGYRHPADGCPLVLTPHPGEFRRLAEPTGIDDDPIDPDQRPAAAAALAAFHHAVVVLKGQHSVVTDARRVYLNQTGNPALATAGTGDVLTGLTAGLLAQGMSPFDAAALGCCLHGAAADRWAQDKGPQGLVAHDLLAHLIYVIHARR